MLIIRLQRVGKKNEPTFRVVLTDSKNGPKSGKFLEVLGSYDPRDKNITKIDGEKVTEWISKGAQVSDTVHNILINQGIIKGDKINVLPKKSPIIDEEALKAEQEAKEKAEAEAAEKAKAEAEAAAAANQPTEETPAEPAESQSTEDVAEESTEKTEDTPSEASEKTESTEEVSAEPVNETDETKEAPAETTEPAEEVETPKEEK